MKRHLPRGRWDTELLSGLSWRELSEISRYPYRRSKAGAKRRIHRLDRRQARRQCDRAAIDVTPDR